MRARGVGARLIERAPFRGRAPRSAVVALVAERVRHVADLAPRGALPKLVRLRSLEHARAAVGSSECRGHATIQYLHTTPGSTLVATPRMSIASRVPGQEGGVLVWFHHLWPKEVRPFQWGGGGGKPLPNQTIILKAYC